MRAARSTALGLAALLCCSAALADGVCEKEHDMTPAEIAAMTAALETAVRGVPGALEQWAIQGDDALSVPASVCLEDELRVWSYGHTRTFRKTTGHEAREQAVAATGKELRASMAAKQPRIDALQARGAELGAQLGEAAQKGDTARIAAISAEMDEISKEYQAIFNEDGDQARFQDEVAQAYRDMEIAAHVAVNALSAAPGDGAEAMTAPRGAMSAFRWTTDDYTGHALVLVGPWKPSVDGFGYELALRSGAPNHAAQGIAVTVHADVDRLAEFVAKIDFAAVAAALSR
jgi:hypothetical protein